MSMNLELHLRYKKQCRTVGLNQTTTDDTFKILDKNWDRIGKEPYLSKYLKTFKNRTRRFCENERINDMLSDFMIQNELTDESSVIWEWFAH